MKVRCKNECIFVDRSVLNNCCLRLLDFLHLRKTTVQVIDLQIEGPTLHILVEIVQVRVLLHIFKVCFPSLIAPPDVDLRVALSPAQLASE